MDLSAGQVVADKYRIDGVIGSGGMGIVVAATHIDLHQRVAIKLLRDASEEALARFQREARFIVRLKSEHVARVFDIGSLEDDTPYIVMERLEGEDLAKVLEKNGPLSVEQSVDYVLEASEAVAEAHTLGMVHRDLKPANFFVARGPGGTGSVKVLDFGISKTLPGSDSPDSVGSLTNEGVALGSPGYMAPEQIQSSRDVDARADIYSLGAILYRLVSGLFPYKGETVMSLLAEMATTPLAPLSSVAAVPPAFAAIVERCLARDPNARPATVAVLAQALMPFGSQRAKSSTEQILATMGVRPGRYSETMTAVQHPGPPTVPMPARLDPTTPTVVSPRGAAYSGSFNASGTALITKPAAVRALLQAEALVTGPLVVNAPLPPPPTLGRGWAAAAIAMLCGFLFVGGIGWFVLTRQPHPLEPAKQPPEPTSPTPPSASAAPTTAPPEVPPSAVTTPSDAPSASAPPADPPKPPKPLVVAPKHSAPPHPTTTIRKPDSTSAPPSPTDMPGGRK